MELWQDTTDANSQVPDKKLAGALRTIQINGFRKNGTEENSYTLQNALGKFAPLLNVVGKFVEIFSGRMFCAKNVQCRYFVAAVDRGPISLPWMG